MASVEDIYRKIRRGETSDLKFLRPSDAELSEGVERIRVKLSNGAGLGLRSDLPERQIIPGARRWLWLVPAAVAALAFIAILLIPKKTAQPAPLAFATGTTQTFGSVDVRVLTASTITHDFTGGSLSLRLLQGAIAVKRRSVATALTIFTPSGVLTARGTAFIVEHETETSVALSEGRLEWTAGGKTQMLDAQHPQIGRDLSDLRVLLPAEFKILPTPETMPAKKPKRLAGSFAPKDCVIYTINGNRREGIIREVVHGKFRVAHEGIDEPELLSGGDLIGCGN